MKIAIDLDDTLSVVDRMKGAKEYLARKSLPFRLLDEHAHVLQNMYDWKIEDVNAFIRDGGIKVFTEAPPREGARETLKKWRDAGHRVIILTARIPEWFGDPVEVSRGWLDRNEIPYDEIVANVWEKGEYCVEHGIGILIEDNFEISKKAQDLGVNAVLFVDKHNLARAQEIKFRGGNWQEIAAAAENFLKL